MRILKRILLCFLWLLIPSSIVTGLSAFADINLGGIPVILVYAPFVYLIRKTVRGDYDKKIYIPTESNFINKEPVIPEPLLSKDESPAPPSYPSVDPGFASVPDISDPVHEISDPVQTPAPSFNRSGDPAPSSIRSDDPAPSSVRSDDPPFFSTEDLPKFCDNCGTECERWVKFCPACGCKTFSVWVKKPLQVTSDLELLSKADKSAKKYILKKRAPVIVLCVLCAVLLISSVTLGILLGVSREREQDLSGQISFINSNLNTYKHNVKVLSDKNSSLQAERDELKESYDFYLKAFNEALDDALFFIESTGFVVEGYDGYHKYYCDIVKNAEYYHSHNKAYCENALGLEPHSCWDSDSGQS